MKNIKTLSAFRYIWNQTPIFRQQSGWMVHWWASLSMREEATAGAGYLEVVKFSILIQSNMCIYVYAAMVGWLRRLIVLK